MATSKKRSCENMEVDDETAKKICDRSDKKLETFLKWCEKEGLTLNQKVSVGKEGACAQYGMVATCDIAEGECLFEIPRHMLLTPQTSAISEILLSDEGLKSLHSNSGWVPTLVALMYEYTNPNSKWAPYVQLVPDFDELELPMFWPSEALSQSRNTGLDDAVSRDLKNITSEFTDIVLPFLKQHENVFSPQCLNMKFYQKMVAFVMAYSFSEPMSKLESEDEDEAEGCEGKSVPMMVPMADILNHVAKNNAHLDFGKESLKMVATKAIRQGDEVFNTYGQLGNMQLLHMYGFAEAYPNNYYDTVEIPTSILHGIMTDKNGEDVELLGKKWTCLSEMGLCGNDEKNSIVIGVDGVLTEEETLEILKVLTMDSERFTEYQENEGWLDDDDDDDPAPDLSFDELPKMPLTWRRILHRCALAKMKMYECSIEEASRAVSPENIMGLSKRQQFALYVIHGQMELLNSLIKACVCETDEQDR